MTKSATKKSYKNDFWQLMIMHLQGSYKTDLKIKYFSRTFQHLKILFQDHFIFIESALNIAMQKWVLRKQDTL